VAGGGDAMRGRDAAPHAGWFLRRRAIADDDAQ
jgi:hypothetical protein